MARHAPNGIVQAMQSLRLNSTPSYRLAIPSLRPSTRSYATETESQTPAAEPPLPTETGAESQLEVKAAPEIDFSKFSQRPARIIPASRAYFSGNPRFIDHVLTLEDLQLKYANLPQVPAGEAPRMAWFKLAQFRDYVGEVVPVKKYKSLIKLLQQLNRIEPGIAPKEVRTSLAQFLRPGNPYAREHTPREVDENGCARAKGKRKTSSAVVQLVEGEGEVLVNGRSLVDIFQRVDDREKALWALQVADRIDKYNVWARVRGGGTTGQAEAITLAIGRALMLHEPGLKPVLRKGKLLRLETFPIDGLFVLTISQLVSSPSMLVVWRERSRVMSRPARCPLGSSGKHIWRRAMLSIFIHLYYFHPSWQVADMFYISCIPMHMELLLNPVTDTYQ